MRNLSTYRKKETPSIWQSRLELVHLEAHSGQISIQMPIIKRTQLHLYGL